MVAACPWFLLPGLCNIFIGDRPKVSEEQFQWSSINYTWETTVQYQQAIGAGNYIPENIFPTGIKPYQDKFFVVTPKYRNGVPLTLSYVPKNAEKINPLLVPFPSWGFHDERSCTNMQNVQSVEIDPKGIMWVIDGVRMFTTNCPPKLLQFDLTKGGGLIHTFIFPNEISLQNGAFLNDLVLDGDFAYITDASNIDPGLIVYSRSLNRAWKLRDSAMFVSNDRPVYAIDDYPVVNTGPINGIALSPAVAGKTGSGRRVFFSSMTGYGLSSVPANIIRDYELYRNGSWRDFVRPEGRKQGDTDGMMMDNKGNLYYSLTSLNAVARWNTNSPLNRSSEIMYQSKSMVWPDSFGMDQEGNLYVVTNRAINYLNMNVQLNFTADIKFRLYKFFTGTRSYQYL
ncbi:hypothetical protein JTB14_006225 [Gonioctena quinquepunctata]|nr:hypothetical protein JTB14_006225 [Gonioctena quinquepunctata]